MKLAAFAPSLCAWNRREGWQTWPRKEPVIIRVCVWSNVSLKQSIFSDFICLWRWLLQVGLVSPLSWHLYVWLDALSSAAGFIWFFKSAMADTGLYLASHAVLPAHSTLSGYMVCGICVVGNGGFCGMSLRKPGHVCSLLLLWLWGRSQNTICPSLLNWLYHSAL